MVRLRVVLSVFSSKFEECVLACNNIVILHAIGIMAVSVSPVCARLKPLVSLTGKRASPPRVRNANVCESQITITKTFKKKNQKTKCM
jgi:hypothetical protein